MGKEADPKKDPIQTKKKGSPLVTILVVVLFLAAAGIGYFYVVYERFPTPGEVKDKAVELAGKAKELAKGPPIEIMTTSPEKNTAVVVSLKKDSVDELKRKFEKIRVVIPQLDYDMTAPQSEWPVIGRKQILEYHPIKIDEVSCTVFGISADGKMAEIYKQEK